MPDLVTDVLGEPFTSETIPLESDSEGEVVATLVSLASAHPTERAVLHVHGFADYFFQTEYAEWWTSRGYTFYALDLRKYGRSLREHHTPNYVEDLREYYEELDAAWERIAVRDGHSSVVATGHSTGGLTLPLWAHARRPEALAGMVLNSPWFDLQGAGWLRSPAARTALDQLGAYKPRRVIPRKVTGFYGRSLHRDHEGEFDYNLGWKPIESWPVYAGWLRAIRRGQTTLHDGLDVPAPVLVLSSGRAASPDSMSEEVHVTDVVLDVEQIRRWASSVGRTVVSVAVDGARHDMVLSRPEVRKVVYGEVDRFLTAYVE